MGVLKLLCVNNHAACNSITGPGQEDFPLFTDLSGGEVYCAPSQDGDSCPTPETHYICRDIRYIEYVRLYSYIKHVHCTLSRCVSSIDFGGGSMRF